MESTLVFEQNFDIILNHLLVNDECINISTLKGNGVIGNINILIDQLFADRYIRLNVDTESICITKLGIKFICNEGGYEQAWVNKAKKEMKNNSLFNFWNKKKKVSNLITYQPLKVSFIALKEIEKEESSYSTKRIL